MGNGENDKVVRNVDKVNKEVDITHLSVPLGNLI